MEDQTYYSANMFYTSNIHIYQKKITDSSKPDVV